MVGWEDGNVTLKPTKDEFDKQERREGQLCCTYVSL